MMNQGIIFEEKGRISGLGVRSFSNLSIPLPSQLAFKYFSIFFNLFRQNIKGGEV